MTIRLATQSDKTRAIELLRDSYAGAGFSEESGVGGFTFRFEPAYAERLFTRCTLQDNGLCLVYVVEGVAQGILMATAEDYDLGPVKIGVERILWVDPKYRGSAAIRLIDTFEKWAAERGCAFTHATGKRDPRFEKFLSRRGYLPAETHYLKRIS